MQTDDRRKLAGPLREWFQRLNKAEEAVQQLMQPYRDAIGQISDARKGIEAFMEAEGVIIGKCLDCLTPLIEGDSGYAYAGGEMCCAGCSPTFAEVRAEAIAVVNAQEGDYDAEAIEAARVRLKAVADHVAAGGSLSDKQTWEL